MAGASKATAKRGTVADVTALFRDSSAAVLTEYRGLTTAELTELRRSLGSGTSYQVIKNTLTRRAAADAGVEGLDALLSGPTAVAFVEGDPVEAAKALKAFGKDHPLLIVKGGILDGKPLTAAEIAKLADLESREVLLAKLAGAMKGSLSQAVGLFAAPLSQFARLAAALEAAATADPSILKGGAGTPAPVVEEPAAEADEPVATASEGRSVSFTVDEAVAVEEGEPAPASNADATEEAPVLPEDALPDPEVPDAPEA
jgi:large subunit ribosomal protein L10